MFSEYNNSQISKSLVLNQQICQYFNKSQVILIGSGALLFMLNYYEQNQYLDNLNEAEKQLIKQFLKEGPKDFDFMLTNKQYFLTNNIQQIQFDEYTNLQQFKGQDIKSVSMISKNDSDKFDLLLACNMSYIQFNMNDLNKDLKKSIKFSTNEFNVISIKDLLSLYKYYSLDNDYTNLKIEICQIIDQQINSKINFNYINYNQKSSKSLNKKIQNINQKQQQQQINDIDFKFEYNFQQKQINDIDFKFECNFQQNNIDSNSNKKLKQITDFNFYFENNLDLTKNLDFSNEQLKKISHFELD